MYAGKQLFMQLNSDASYMCDDSCIIASKPFLHGITHHIMLWMEQIDAFYVCVLATSSLTHVLVAI